MTTDANRGKGKPMRRPNGKGTVERHRAKWRARVVIDGRRRTLGTYDDEARAWRMLSAHNAEVAEGAIIAPGSVTLAALGDEWLTRRELHGSQTRDAVRGVRAERSVWQRHVAASPLAPIALQSIRPRDVEDFVAWLRRRAKVAPITRTVDGEKVVDHRPTATTISAQVQRHALRLLRGMLDDAVRREIIATNPAALVRVRQGTSKRIDDDWLRADEIDALLGCEALSRRDRTVYACAIGLALRLDDLRSLRVADVRLDSRVPGPHVAVVVGKTGRPHRVPILPWLAPWLRAHLATLPDGAKWLFPARDGLRYARGKNFRWPEKREKGRARRPSALELAGVVRRIRFHDLRGTCATHLALGTWGRAWSLTEVCSMLAHGDQRTTERYVRRALDTLSTAAQATPGGPTGCPPQPPPIVGSPTLPPRFERGTFGLGSPCESDPFREVRPSRGQCGGNAAAWARQIIVDVAEGRALERWQVDELVCAVLEEAPAVLRLAMSMRPGDAFEARRALELAALVLRTPDAASSDEAHG